MVSSAMIKDRPSLWQKAIVALVLSTLIFSRQIGGLLVDDNRYYMLWQSGDSIALLLAVLALAGIGFGISVLMTAARWDRARRAYNHIFLLALANAALSLVPQKWAPQLGQSTLRLAVWCVIWTTVVGTIAFSFWSPRSRLVVYGANCCLLFSPLVPILFFQTLAMRNWSSPGETNPHLHPTIPAYNGKATAGKHPVFIFLFDEWSYPRSTKEDEFLPELVNLRKLSAQCFNFRRTWSFSSRTKYSVPAVMFQTDSPTRIRKNNIFLPVDGKPVSTSKVPSVFTLAKDHGYTTALQGFYQPYRRMFGDQLDYCRSFSIYPRGDTLLDNMIMTTVRNHYWFTDPATAYLRRLLEGRLQGRRIFHVNAWLLDESLRLIRACSSNTLAFFHWPLPHGPFVFNADGSYHGSYSGNAVLGFNGSSEDYHRQLLYLDRIVGRIIEQLKAAGKFDDALLIFTSDHGWRWDPDVPVKDWTADPILRKVPLLVKLPGQQQARVVNKTIYNHLQLRPIIEQVLSGNIEESKTLEIVENLEELPAPKGRYSIRPKP